MQYQPVAFSSFVEVSALFTVHYFHFEPDHQRIDEQHDFWELVYLDQNEAYACTPDHKYLLHQGEMILHAPNMPHGIEGTGASAANIGIISFQSDCPLLFQLAQHIITLNAVQRGLLCDILQEGYAAFGVQLDMSHSRAFHPLPSAPFGSLELITLYIRQLLILLIRDALSIQETLQLDTVDDKPSDLLPVVNFMRNHLYSDLTFDDICRQCGIGATALKTKFRNQYGMGVMAYYQNLKIAEARRLLRKRSYTFAVIAEKLCFSSTHYFSNCFKKAVGMTPTQYIHSISPQTLL